MTPHSWLTMKSNLKNRHFFQDLAVEMLICIRFFNLSELGVGLTTSAISRHDFLFTAASQPSNHCFLHPWSKPRRQRVLNPVSFWEIFFESVHCWHFLKSNMRGSIRVAWMLDSLVCIWKVRLDSTFTATVHLSKCSWEKQDIYFCPNCHEEKRL